MRNVNAPGAERSASLVWKHKVSISGMSASSSSFPPSSSRYDLAVGKKIASTPCAIEASNSRP